MLTGMLLVGGTFTVALAGGGAGLNAFLFVAGPGDCGGGVVRINLPVLPFFLFAGGTYLPSLLLDRD